ncbi:hypothetical protein AAY55_13820 [Vibrio metoecus]|uniref:Uncharacterized protein n=1 Tax=Vibrio metoecus TaxID=1481663 RepID=A0A0Q0PRS2_VIBMT|nr:hypothetical protein AAY55_13820 [Vibrio metoecus]
MRHRNPFYPAESTDIAGVITASPKKKPVAKIPSNMAIRRQGLGVDFVEQWRIKSEYRLHHFDRRVSPAKDI